MRYMKDFIRVNADFTLRRINNKIVSAKPDDIPELFKDMPLSTFGSLLLNVPPQYSNLKKYFPVMPPDKVQDSWTGSHGIVLMEQSLAFVNTLASGYEEITGKAIQNTKILDFGCGWGRIIRLLYKYVSFENIYAVDPWDQSIELCREYGVKANIALSDYVPRELPFEQAFDLIYAFSVFTHLSEKTASIVLATLRNYIVDTGLLVITIRPKEYWQFHQGGIRAAEMIQVHDEKGFAFIPHNRPPIDGDITYGDTSLSLSYIAEHFPQWKLVKSVINPIDSFQVILFLRPN
jgi:2-polyprenyl-3-methyl-5-hydroxy-6-metoxy-1,4-benzoquinol methylase